MLEMPSDSRMLNTMSGMQVISVNELTRCIRGVIEAEDLFADVWVRGEISNLTKHSSGHIYFSLKDENALVRCVVWNNIARSIRYSLTEGMSVIANGRLTVYEKQGQYQLVLKEVTPDGIGALYLGYEQLKAKLQAEGLFDEARKKPMPAFPREIAIVTSPTAAALRDMVTIARRRMPTINLLLVPTLMQGADSEKSVIESLHIADGVDADVIILGRGGGSVEDLWTFNAEGVVRALSMCRTPVVSAIGHETDYTLCDFAADLRAPTPSAAVELVIPDREELNARIQAVTDAITSSVASKLADRQANLDLLINSSAFKYPEQMIHNRRQSLDSIVESLGNVFRETVSNRENGLGVLSASLQSLSPLGVLARGYGIVRRAEDGIVVRRLSDVAIGQTIETLISDGKVLSEVKDVQEGWI